ncbi:MAG TPA: LysM peptidoglycan-binding domain-containing protein [Accumulibacter sp.]|nr:LysM peptidoglycan-binding domain-containing protein [Accumulibacter sp.]HMW16965.1 LysM peptidoglycan-binding domain-containing protein [Accumulibacter sp.]HMX22698.1 LysM peptidoglycan-binding domain-containing protein [Accumulibacter sp.]HMY07570.1 LysM peptidoglycan-binding domain-containing protein [Accumulibacter sp.]HNC17217.1 LysM peptidoglycan-binding domain-containing protein [Accumulibacter sp.]
MIRFLSALLLATVSLLCGAAGQPIELADGAPTRHIVLPGDTLWGLSSKFLKDPWRWPEIWGMNRPEIANPHRIYPGDVIVLERDTQGNPRLRLQRDSRGLQRDVRLVPQIHVDKMADAIPAIAPNVIRPFLSEPLIIEANGLETAPRIVATQEDRVFLGPTDRAYVSNASPTIDHWHVYRNGKALLDPDSQAVLGYEAFYLGTAKQLQPGEPASFEILTAKQEISRGDRLIPLTRPQLVDYIPHKPEVSIEGRVLSVYGGVGIGGVNSVIAISRGSADGLEIGHVLSLQRNRTLVQRDHQDRQETVVVPPHRHGLAFVFRTFQHIAYALVVRADGTIETNDFVRTP